MSTAKYFSTIDLKNAYLRIPLDEDSSSLTAIKDPLGHYRYRFLQLGLSESPAIFQKVIYDIMSVICGIVAYPGERKRLADLLKRKVGTNVKITAVSVCFQALPSTVLVAHLPRLAFVVLATVLTLLLRLHLHEIFKKLHSVLT